MKSSLTVALLIGGGCAAWLPAPSVSAQGGSSRYTITTIADNTAANSSFSTFSDAFPAINDNGAVVFRATLTDGSQLLYSSVNGTLTPLLSSTNTTGQFTGFLDMSAAINNQGTIVFAGSVSDGSPGIFSLAQGGGAPVLVVDGASDPVDFGGTIGSPAINDDGTIVFSALGTEDPNTGIHVGGYYQVASGGAPVTLYSSGNNGSLYPPTVNASGQVAFIIDPGVPEFSGQTDPGQQVWRIDGPGVAPTVLAASGSPYSYFVDQNDLVDIDAAGTVVFSATNADGSQGVYLADTAGTAQTVVTTSSTGFAKLENVAFGKSDNVVFYGQTAAGGGGTFDGTDPVANQIFFDPYRGGNFTALSSVSHNQINSSGQLVFTYELDNGIKGIAVATPGATPSPTPTPTPTPKPTPTPTPTPGSGPTVSLVATIPAVTVGSGDIGEFTVTLSAAQTSDLTVNYTIKGTGINGTDYVLLTGHKKFKSGKTSKPIKIEPLGNLEGAAKKTVKITLAAGTGYTVGTVTPLKVKILAGQ